MFVIARFQLDSQETTVDVRAFLRSFVEHGSNVAAKICDNAGYMVELPRFIHKLD